MHGVSINNNKKTTSHSISEIKKTEIISQTPCQVFQKKELFIDRPHAWHFQETGIYLFTDAMHGVSINNKKTNSHSILQKKGCISASLAIPVARGGLEPPTFPIFNRDALS